MKSPELRMRLQRGLGYVVTGLLFLSPISSIRGCDDLGRPPIVDTGISDGTPVSPWAQNNQPKVELGRTPDSKDLYTSNAVSAAPDRMSAAGTPEIPDGPARP